MKNCPPDFVEKIYWNPRAYDMPKIWMLCNEPERLLIAKKPPDFIQEISRTRLIQKMTTKVMNMGAGLEWEYSGLGRTTWDVYVDGVRYRKEADDSYEPSQMNMPRDQRRELPTIVVHRGYMDFIERYRVEAAWWLIATRGDPLRKEIQSVIVIGVERTKPNIVIGDWRAVEKGGKEKNEEEDNPRRRIIPTKTQMVSFILSEEDGSIHPDHWSTVYDPIP